MVRDIEGFSSDAGGAMRAAMKLAEAFLADKIARDTLNSQDLQATLVQRAMEAEKVSKEKGTHRSKRRGRAGHQDDKAVGGNWVKMGLHDDTGLG